METVRDGDIFYWSWRDHSKSGHCCSWKAIYRNGYLEDQFWSHENKRWTWEQAKAQLDLEFKGNFDELEKINAYDAKYYHRNDITDLRHSNSYTACVYKRKGAQRDRAICLELAKYELQKREWEKSSAERDIQSLTRIISDIEAGGDLEPIYIPEAA